MKKAKNWRFILTVMIAFLVVGDIDRITPSFSKILWNNVTLGSTSCFIAPLKQGRQVHRYSGTPGRTVWAQSRQTKRPSL